MRAASSPSHAAPVRFLVDLSSDADGRVSGEVAVADQPPVPFSGWLELLRVLEDRADHRTNGQENPWDA